MRDKRTGKIGTERTPLLLSLIQEGKTAGQIADLLNVNPETVRKFSRKRNITIETQNMTLENHPCWNDGTVVDRSGYLLTRVLVDSKHGYLIRALQKRGKNGSDKSGYAPIHRIVMHDKIGRAIQKGEVVDHIDGNVQNNHPDNLRLFASNSDHLRETLKGKIPNWTEEGFSRITGRPKKNRSLPD